MLEYGPEPKVARDRPVRVRVEDLEEDGRILETLLKVYARRSDDGRFEGSLRDMVVGTLSGKDGRAIILAAPSGAGKTSLVEHASRRVPGLSLDGRRPGMLFVQVPSPCSLADLGAEIATAAGHPVRKGLKAPVAWDAAWRVIRVKKIRFLWIDEVHSITEVANAKSARQIRNTLKMALINARHKVGLVLSGDPSIVGFLRGDAHVRRRSDVFAFAPLDGGMLEVLAKTVARLAEKVGMGTPRNLRNQVVPRLAHAALGQFGTAIEMTRFTIVGALRIKDGRDRSPSSLTLEHFATHWARSTGAANTENPFLTARWADLDVAAILGGDGGSAPNAAGGAKASRGAKPSRPRRRG
ncbi:AAA family ATPase [Lichenibacterium dinghuense]|uniref:AAA family ATPase n=1 Tax=Lichenibacterium dinghuense TaxID=2895977 RepID=UPI001F249A6C|nr:TniB family NTP-binding protein [Lichenibacterium sp. 6Y81]